MKNSLGRFVSEDFRPFVASDAYTNKERIKIPEKKTTNVDKMISSLREVFDRLNITDGMTLSFHHHLRDGDRVLNLVAAEIKRRNLKNMVLAPSSIFPCHSSLVELIENKNVVQIYTNYVNGAVADAISQGKLEKPLVMMTHGGRPQAIESGYLKIDVAFIACPNADSEGNGNGFA